MFFLPLVGILVGGKILGKMLGDDTPEKDETAGCPSAHDYDYKDNYAIPGDSGSEVKQR